MLRRKKVLVESHFFKTEKEEEKRFYINKLIQNYKYILYYNT